MPPTSTRVKNGIYRRGASWYLLVKIDGKQKRKSFGKNRDAAVAALNAIQMQRSAAKVTQDWSGLDAIFKQKVETTFSEAAREYLDERANLKANTIRCYREILTNYLLPSFGKAKLADITEASIARFQSKLLFRLSPVRVNNIMGLLRYILKVSTRRKLIEDNPATNVKPATEQQPDIDPFTREELQACLCAVNPQYRALFLCQAWTGMRPNELFALKWEDVRFEENAIYIRHGRVRGSEGVPKTRKSQRAIPMLSIVKEALDDHKNRCASNIQGYVFVSKRGSPINKHLDREWKVACKRACVRHRPSYQLRHSFASLCLQVGCTPAWVAEVLGHSTMQTTFRHYARFIRNAAKENEYRIEEFLTSAVGDRGSVLGDHNHHQSKSGNVTLKISRAHSATAKTSSMHGSVSS